MGRASAGVTGRSRWQVYSAPKSMFGMKAHIAALEKGLEVELVMVPFTDQRGDHPKHPDVLNA